jgi:hypothetical protein
MHTRMSGWMRRTVFMLVLAALLISTGCMGPRPRWGYLPTATWGIPFPDPDNLGPHGYHWNPFEKGGLVYTCRGGHIDIDHVRGNADLTRSQVERLRKVFAEKKQNYRFSVPGETSVHLVTFTYPDNWDTLADKQAVIDELAFAAGGYFTYSATVWHEILTWYGVHFAGFEPEFNSAFSWEDNYSNVLGIHISIEAMQSKAPYDQAVTRLISLALERLGVQSSDVAKAASDSVRGSWYTGNLVPDMRMRNFDIGLGDGTITPTLIPNVPACPDAKPEPIAIPSLEPLDKYGLTFTHQVKPRVFEQGSIYKAAGSKEIFPAVHYPVLIRAMKEQAIEMGYRVQD